MVRYMENSMSCYAPLWFKENDKNTLGRIPEAVSPLK